MLQKIGRITGCTQRVPRYAKLTAGTIAFRICMVWIGNNWLFGQENPFCAKKTPVRRLFLCARIGVTWLWKDLDAKPLTPGQLLGCPWKLWGITLQTSYVEGRWHQNWAHTSPLHFFTVGTRKFAKKWFFGCNAPYPKILNGKIFRGYYPRNPYELRIQKI